MNISNKWKGDYIVLFLIENNIIHQKTSLIELFGESYREYDFVLRSKSIVYIREELFPQYNQIQEIIIFFKKLNNENTIYLIEAITEPLIDGISAYHKILTQECNISDENIYLITATDVDNRYMNSIYVPYFWSSIIQPTNNYDIENIFKNKIISSFNRRTNSSRIILVCDILKNFNKDEYVVSIGVDDVLENIDNHNLSLFTRVSYLNGMGLNFLSETLPLVCDSNVIDEFSERQFLTIDEAYYCLFDLVNETTSNNSCTHDYLFHDNVFFPSEKSFKPFYTYQIPIINANVGFYEKFKKMGFDLFEDVVPINDIDNSFFIKDKSKIIFEFLHEFKKNNDYNDFFKKNIDRFQYNFNLVNDYANKYNNVYIEFINSIFDKYK